MKNSERIREWVSRKVSAVDRDKVFDRIITVAIDYRDGYRDGSDFERSAVEEIFPEWKGEKSGSK